MKLSLTSHSFARPLTAILFAALLCAVPLGSHRAAGDEPVAGDEGVVIPAEEIIARGQSIYETSCASCHGDGGEGVEGAYPNPLVGDASVGELTALITDTMPEGEPETCVGEDAAAVAAYIHHSFYSEAAQIRNRPPRIGLARLTADQLRQSLADLYAQFDGVPSVDRESGVKAIYFNGSRWKNEEKKIERIDPVIDFDFGHESPGEGIEAESFYIYWEGGLRPDVSGRYEIVVDSTCSFKLGFGERDRVLIDNHVQSGDKSEFRETVYLTAGRVYPFVIDFIQRKRSTEQPPARISLSWVPPHQTQSVIPTRNLLSGGFPPVFSLQADLPPDDRSYGYERGIAINRQWGESTTAAALEFADIAVQELWPKYQKKHKDDSDENRARLKSFLVEIVETAFHGPLSDELRHLYVDSQVDATEDNTEAIKRSLLISLKSPRFLYPLLDDDRPPSERAANRLALVLFDSLPSDDWLVQQAREGKLETEDQVRAAAERMVNDFRTRGKTREMLMAWLNLSHFGEITKDQEKFAGFDAEIVSDLRSSLLAFLDEVVWSESSDYRQLIQADWVFTTDRLAAFYGDTWKPAEADGPPMRRSVADPEHRFGVLTHPLMLSGLAYHDSTSPIHRGVFLIRYMLGRTLRPPNEAFTPLSPDLHPDLTTRERVHLQTSPESCQVCHVKINGLGFTLENFDAIGRFRTSERDKPIDASGSYTSRDDQTVAIDGARGLAEFLVTSDDAHRAFVGRVFQHFVKQPIAAYGPDTLDRLTEQFRASGFNIRQLIVEVAVIAATEESAEELSTS